MAILNRTFGNVKTLVAAVSGGVQGTFNLFNSTIEYGVENTTYLKTAHSDTESIITSLSADKTTELVNVSIGKYVNEISADFFTASPKAEKTTTTTES